MFLLTPDTDFGPKGARTNIKYLELFNFYKKVLLDIQKKSPAQFDEIYAFFNRMVFNCVATKESVTNTADSSDLEIGTGIDMLTLADDDRDSDFQINHPDSPGASHSSESIAEGPPENLNSQLAQATTTNTALSITLTSKSTNITLPASQLPVATNTSPPILLDADTSDNVPVTRYRKKDKGKQPEGRSVEERPVPRAKTRSKGKKL